MKEMLQAAEKLKELINSKDIDDPILTMTTEFNLELLIRKLKGMKLMEHPDITFYNKHGMTKEQWAEKNGLTSGKPKHKYITI